MLKRNRLLLSLTVVLIAALIGSAHYQYIETRELQIQSYADKQIILAKQAAASVREYINVQIAALQVLAENKDVDHADEKYRNL